MRFAKYYCLTTLDHEEFTLRCPTKLDYIRDVK